MQAVIRQLSKNLSEKLGEPVDEKEFKDLAEDLLRSKSMEANLLETKEKYNELVSKSSNLFQSARKISNSIGEDKRAIELIFGALAAHGIPPKVIPMRGGTDGAALSSRGLVTPNYFTGAHNFHSRFEFLPISAFVKSYQVTRSICLLAARG